MTRFVDLAAWPADSNAAQVQVLAANFAFNDTPAIVIIRVEQSYYQFLECIWARNKPLRATRSTRSGAAIVDDVEQWLTTLPIRTRRRTLPHRAEYELQAAGADDIAHGPCTSLGTTPPTVHTRPTTGGRLHSAHHATRVDSSIDRALASALNLLSGFPDGKHRKPRARKRMILHPSLNFTASPSRAIAVRHATAVSPGTTAGLAAPWPFGLNWPCLTGGTEKIGSPNRKQRS